jgi:gamma-glutamyltranspeptidase
MWSAPRRVGRRITGLLMLARGGNAVDAALATAI